MRRDKGNKQVSDAKYRKMLDEGQVKSQRNGVRGPDPAWHQSL
jgi:hypothetical protein